MKYFMHLRKFTTISITGPACMLNCRFCRGRYLKNMVDLSKGDPGKTLRELFESGVRGILISGGFTREGRLPIEGYVDYLMDGKRKYGFIYNAHLGLQKDIELLNSLKRLIDVVDFEFTLSNYIIKYIRGLNLSGDSYIETLNKMIEAGLHVVPHLYLWHPGFTRDIFTREIKVIEEHGLREITLLVYIPESRNMALPSTSTLINNLRYARKVFGGKIYLGCMRPYQVKNNLDRVAVEEELVERIANPVHELISDNSELYDACCSLPEHLLSGFKLELDQRGRSLY
ncbi:radical SAM protein [Desulfurococcus amylolyticus]|uniref:Radical SAM domain protein n=1 Tax=Desulfurococcus amylolyticus DSM 16532 TaxID=768672 RepID=I3XQ65_DESAM|nr:radical SAM protein [Desulfurococcus amylolyticus]AFL66089.1 Radical SAM domain protein [Desulfurococcus amylolyticus DSM 16532]